MRYVTSGRSLLLLWLGAIMASAVGAAELSNLAVASQGGSLVFFSSQYNDQGWAAQHLIDGSTSAGWAAQGNGPQSVIIAFADRRLALVEDFLINPYTSEDANHWVKEVEISVSTTFPFRDFHTLGRLTITDEGRAHVFSPPQPVEARYVKVSFLRNGGGGYMEAGEVAVMGRLLPDAPPAPAYRNVAAASAGARIESFTSQFNDSGWAVANLLADDGGYQWAGRSSAAQEVVIALPELANVTDVAINNGTREDPQHWARDVAIELSTEAAYRGFKAVGRLSLPPAADLHTLTLPAPTPAKFVKLLFQSNHGGGYMEAGRVRVYAAASAGVELRQQLEASGRAVTHDILFATDSAEILPQSETVLREIAAILKADSDLELVIEGHTDNVGGAEHNLELSRRRADAVKRWLVDRAGTAEIRLTTAGYGLTRPVADNATGEGRALNRRVELAKR